MNDIPVRAILVLVLFLFCAGVFAIIFKRLRFPYTIGLVLVGLALGGAAYRIEAIAFLSQVHFTPNLILYILLPTLVFEAALNMNTRLLIRNLLPVILLAAPGLVFATLATGLIIGFLTPLSFGAAMLFGALISATDPVAVIAVFRELGAPKRLTMLVDGESLFNDATAMVMFSIVLGLLTGGTVLGFTAIAWASVQFVLVFLGGTLVGAFVGYAMVQILSLSNNDPLVEIAFTAVIAYVAFILAQFYMDLSGVMAVVGAGLVVSYYGSTRFSPAVKEHLSHFWEFACFAANSFIFLLLGLTENYLSHGVDRLYRVGLVVLAAVFAVTVARALLIFGFVPCINKLSRRPPIGFPYQAIMFWGGLRGALPIALAMSLTAEQVGGDLNRSLIIDCTLGVVLFTLLIQGTTISRLMNWLGLGDLSPVERTLLANTRLALKREGLAAVEAIGRKWPALDLRPVERVAEEYRSAIDGLRSERADAGEGLGPERVRSGVLWMLAMYETNAVWRDLYDAGFLREDVLREYEQYFESCREDILRGVMPPRTPRRSAIGDRTLGLLLRWTERIGATRLWTNRLRRRRVEGLHAIALAAASSLQRLEANMAHLRDLSDASNETVEQCMSWIRAWAEESLLEIGRVVKHSPATVAELDTNLVRRLASETERLSLEELVKKGGISERLAAMLE